MCITDINQVFFLVLFSLRKLLAFAREIVGASNGNLRLCMDFDDRLCAVRTLSNVIFPFDPKKR